MKLLPCNLWFVKDAAQAVKRIAREMFTAVNDDVLTELLGLPRLIVTMFTIRKEGEQEALHLWCVHKEDIALCPRCGKLSDEVHEEERRCVRHLDIWGKKTFLHFMSRRFDCEQCGKPFAEELSFVRTRRRQTIALEFHIYRSCLASDKKKVAKRESLSHSTVCDIFNYFAQHKGKPSADHGVRILGIDEISLKKRHKQFALVISDIDRKCIVAVLPTREKDALEQWIDSLSEQQRRTIRFVSIDMWVPYRQAVQGRLPHATLVVDRFHVMKQLNNRITRLRTAIQSNSSIEVKSTLKGSRWILVRNRCDLTLKQEAHLQGVLELCPELRTLYLLKEEFRTIFEKMVCKQKAHKFLSAWMLKCKWTGNKYLNKFANTLKNWWDEILNYFIDHVTNGFVEGLNGAIRIIIRSAFGYRNFANFRLRLLAEYGFPTIPR